MILELIAQGTSNVPADLLMAEGESIFDKIDSIASDGKNTALTFFGAALFVGAVITWAKNRFSVTSGIVALIMVAIGLAVLSQVDAISSMFSNTIDPEAAPAVVEHVDVAADLEGQMVISTDQVA